MPLEVINVDTWKNLPTDIQDIVTKLNLETDAKTSGILNEQQDSFTKTIKAAGVDLNRFSPVECLKIKDTVLPDFHNDWIDMANKADLPGQQLYDTYKTLIAKYTPMSKYVNPFPKN